MPKTRESVAAYLYFNPCATVREVQKACGLSSPSVAQHHMKSLEREHAVQQDWYNRGYRAALEAEAAATQALRERAARLWMLLDDIDTLGDICKPENTAYFKNVCDKVAKRFDVMPGGEVDAALKSPTPTPRVPA